MAAITGLPMFSMRSNTCCPVRPCSRPLVGVWTASSLMSAPATNDLSPAPVTITTRIASSASSSTIARRSSSSVCAFSALSTLGRLMVIVATAPSRSSRRVSKTITNLRLERERIHQPAEDDRGSQEAGEHHPAKSQLLARIVLGDHGEDQRHEEREHREQQEMTAHHLRPTATS